MVKVQHYRTASFSNTNPGSSGCHCNLRMHRSVGRSSNPSKSVYVYLYMCAYVHVPGTEEGKSCRQGNGTVRRLIDIRVSKGCKKGKEASGMFTLWSVDKQGLLWNTGFPGSHNPYLDTLTVLVRSQQVTSEIGIT